MVGADFTPSSMLVSSITSIVWILLLHPVCESCARVTRLCDSPKLVAGGQEPRHGALVCLFPGLRERPWLCPAFGMREL